MIEKNDEELVFIKNLEELERKLQIYENKLKGIDRDIKQARDILADITNTLKEIFKVKRVITKQNSFKEALKKKGVSLEELSKSVNTKAEIIKKMVAEEIPSEINLVIKICEFLGIPYDQLK